MAMLWVLDFSFVHTCITPTPLEAYIDWYDEYRDTYPASFVLYVYLYVYFLFYLYIYIDSYLIFYLSPPLCASTLSFGSYSSDPRLPPLQPHHT